VAAPPIDQGVQKRTSYTALGPAPEPTVGRSDRKSETYDGITTMISAQIRTQCSFRMPIVLSRSLRTLLV